VPANALDGKLTTRFSTSEHQAPGLYFEVKLGTAQVFDELAMEVPNSPTDYARGYDVEVSTNGSAWATAAACAGTGTSEIVSFSTQTARYVRVVLTAGTTSDWWSIDEFNLYGAPVITSAATWRVLSGHGNAFTVTTTGSPVPVLSESGTLPPGLVFKAASNGTATISGAPPYNATGSYEVTITASNGVGNPAVQHLVITLTSAPVITSASTWRVLPGRNNAFTVTTTGSPVPVLSESGTLPPGLVFKAASNGTATISGAPPYNATGRYEVTITASNGVGNPAVQHLVITLPGVSTTTSLSLSPNPASVGEAITYLAQVSPRPIGGAVSFFAEGAPVTGCGSVAVNTTTGQATCSATYWSNEHLGVQAFYSGATGFGPSSSAVYYEVVNLPAPGYWLATANGQVYGSGAAQSLGGVATSAVTGNVVGIAATLTAKGYWVVTANGTVNAFGDARYYGDLPGLGKRVSDIVAIAPTSDARGYYLVGADGGFFTFGDATFHGSLPGIHLHVKDIVGMVATPGGSGYLLVGSDGGVFSFGAGRFYGSLPGLRIHVHDIRAILPSATGGGYILVGADGGAFTFGTGVSFHGSLPGEGVRVNDIVGIALTPDDGGYYMAGSDGHVFGFGDAQAGPEPTGLASNLPVTAIAGT
jgi:hypothetical protein